MTELSNLIESFKSKVNQVEQRINNFEQDPLKLSN